MSQCVTFVGVVLLQDMHKQSNCITLLHYIMKFLTWPK